MPEKKTAARPTIQTSSLGVRANTARPVSTASPMSLPLSFTSVDILNTLFQHRRRAQVPSLSRYRAREAYPLTAGLDPPQHPPFHREVSELHQDEIEQGQPRCLPPVVLLHSSNEARASLGQPT